MMALLRARRVARGARRADAARARWLSSPAAVAGLAFNVKLFEALLPAARARGLLYLVAAREPAAPDRDLARLARPPPSSRRAWPIAVVARARPRRAVPDRLHQRQRLERDLRLQRARPAAARPRDGGHTPAGSRRRRGRPRPERRATLLARAAARAVVRTGARELGGCREHFGLLALITARLAVRRARGSPAPSRSASGWCSAPCSQSHDRPARALPRSVHAGGGHRPRDGSGPAGRSRCARASDGRRGARGGARGAPVALRCTHHAPGARARLPGPGRGRRGCPARPGGRPGGTVRALGQAPGEPRCSAGRRPGAGLRASQPGEHLRAPRPPARLRLRHRVAAARSRSPSSTASCWPAAARPNTSSVPRLRRRRRR